jgi:peptidoglycan/LPS O-acetylase OafA/YrhL
MAILLPLILLLIVLEYRNNVPFTEYMTLRDTDHFTVLFNWNKLKWLMICILFLAVSHTWYDRKIRITKLLGDYSFGIFFVHLYAIEFLQLLDRKGIVTLEPQSLFSFAGVCILITASSILVVYTVKVVFRQRSKFIIGS